MKLAALALGLVAASIACAQIPDIKVQLDATISYRIQPNATPLLEFYDVMGRASTLSLSFYTEQGFRVYVAEKLQHFPGDRAGDLFDEYYVEDRGIWRVGKQYLPFGSGRIFHESAVAARGDTNLIVEGLPMTIAFCDSGQGLDSGVIGRIGSMIGVSAAYGRHFGISGSSLDNVRLPEDAPGVGRGWKEAYGVDAARRLGHLTIRAEAIGFQSGETALDHSISVFDASVSLDPKRGESMTLGWSRIVPNHRDFVRLGGAFSIARNVTFEPMIRFRDTSLFDLTAQIRIKI